MSLVCYILLFNQPFHIFVIPYICPICAGLLLIWFQFNIFIHWFSLCYWTYYTLYITLNSLVSDSALNPFCLQLWCDIIMHYLRLYLADYSYLCAIWCIGWVHLSAWSPYLLLCSLCFGQLLCSYQFTLLLLVICQIFAW